MSDSTAIEAMDLYLIDRAGMVPGQARYHSLSLLAALRDAGFEIYRPDECKQALVEDFNETTGIIDQTVAAAPGRYWLVPVGGETK